MSQCNKNLMCDLNLNSNDDTKKWMLKNHPDKGGNVDSELFTNVTNCYKSREYCEKLSSLDKLSESGNFSTPKMFDKKKRDKIYTCMRQTENWSKILPQHKIDNKNFNPEIVKTAIHNASPKLEQLFNIIQQVDENDMNTHGKYFKHFIFSDVKEEGYGAKILASAFVANGYKNLITAQKISGQKTLKLSLLNAGADGKNKSFGLLSSSAIFNSEFSQKFKKEVLTRYNKRPDNIHGQEMRFIILDSGFKEGIDLFDVKYVHIFEPSMTIADVKQTIGRATRTCGQKGLNFEPNVGWQLFVYNYYIAVPDEIKEKYEVKDIELLNNPADKVIFKNTNKLKDATILYSGFDKTLVNLSEQLYRLAPVFSVDFELTKNIHRIDDMTYLYEHEQSSMSGGKLKDINTINCNGKCGLRSTRDIPATLNFLLYVYIKYGHKKENIPSKNIREYLCFYMKEHPEYCEQVNKEWVNRASIVPNVLYKTLKSNKKNKQSIKQNTSPSYIDVNSQQESQTPYMEILNNTPPSYMDVNAQQESQTPYMEILNNTPPSYMDVNAQQESQTPYMEILNNTPPSYMDVNAQQESQTPYMEIGSFPSSKKTSSKKSTTRRSSSGNSSSKTRKITSSSQRASSSKSPVIIANEIMNQLEIVPYYHPANDINYSIVEYTGKPNSNMKQEERGPPSSKLNFTQMRDFIKTNFSQNFTWNEIKIENKCVQNGGDSRIMTLNPTQNFVRTFFTPVSPYKGMLLWHSVGTGKTCSAIATATSSFEREGYTILWVTRNTLKNDVYKNMFDDVCHIILAERMKTEGLTIPLDPSQRKRLLSKNWIEPISYKTFSNLLTPGAHNEYMDKLIERNGKEDILHKTLIIIDEAHKLYGGDLKASERPNMAIMEKLLQKSYEKSGKKSARLLIMTATPFTNSPMELFKLINLCKENMREKIPTEIREFKRNYMNVDDILTENGIKNLANKMIGYISYLNREQDPTQFAQPIMIEVPALMSTIVDPELRNQIFSDEDKEGKKERNKNNREILKRQTLHIKELNQRLRETQKRIKTIIKERQVRCKTIKKKKDKSKCMQEIKEEIENEMRGIIQNIKKELVLLKENESENKGLKNLEKERIALMKHKLDTLRNDLLQEVMLVDRCKNIQLIK